ncbi:class I SAM-dependent RNA methyltransferase [Desulfovibrio sp. OttesenSCG-928-A18]|nr:class I SAM-dependent RNA methyltransferase [Desulfovibrio sp. OttesenSCG-928-A18]
MSDSFWEAASGADSASRFPFSIPEALRIEDLTVQGEALARYQGRVLFLDSGLPGELVRARVTGKRKGVLRGERVASLQASEHEVEPWCPHAELCGACSWQHFALPAAREWKERQVRESLARIGGVQGPPVLPVLASPRDRGFRNKMTFAFAPDREQGGPGLLGLHKKQSHELVEVGNCGLQQGPVMALLQRVREEMPLLGLGAWAAPSRQDSPGGAGGPIEPGAHAKNAQAGPAPAGIIPCLRFLLVHRPEFEPEGGAGMLVECITGPVASEGGKGTAEALRQLIIERVALLGQGLMRDFPLCGFVHTERRQASAVARGEKLLRVLGKGEYEERFGDLLVRVPYQAFLQTNTGAAALLYEQAARHAALREGDVLWDLYSGVGAIALYLAKDAASKGINIQAHGFELQKEAVAAARRNSRRLNLPNCRFYAGPLADTLRHAPAPDCIILDPPRAGLERRVIDMLLGSPAGRMLYISCDMGTQARDVGLLSPAWQPVLSQPVDMFPYTPHVENLLVLEKKRP